MTASVAAFLDRVRERGAELPPPLSGALLLAAVRLSEARAQPLRPDLLEVDGDGGLELRDGGPDVETAYASPELRKGSALERDPRVLVWAAGALGYELVTLRRLQLGQEPGPEVPGPLAPVIRRALANERKKRFRNLAEMAEAIEKVQAAPSHDEERLILAAVAQTSAPASRPLARIELQKQPSPFPAEAAPVETPPAVHPVFAQQWDPLEAPPEVFFAPPEPEPEPAAPEEPGVVALHETQALEARGEDPLQALRDELKTRREEILVLESRLENLARLGSRISTLEERVRASQPPLSREVTALLEERRFAEAEKALEAPAAAKDPVLQLRLGQALMAQSDADGSKLARAESAFRKAAELDPAWAQPRAQLGTLLMKQGKRNQAMALFRAALALDPGCVEAQAAAGTPLQLRPGWMAAGGAVAGAGLALLAVIALRPPPAPVSAASPPLAAPPVSAAPPVLQSSLLPQGVPVPHPSPIISRAPDTPPPAQTAPIILQQPKPEARVEPEVPPAAAPRRRPAPRKSQAAERAADGDKALRAFNTKAAFDAFSAALKEDPSFASAHRGLGMVYVLQGKNDAAKVEYRKYLDLSPNAPDADQIKRLLAEH